VLHSEVIRVMFMSLMFVDSAGIGRTGAFIVIDVLLRRIEKFGLSFTVLLYFALFAFSGLCLVFVVCLFFNLSSVLYFPACTNVNGTVWPNCADGTLRIYSLTYLSLSLCQ